VDDVQVDRRREQWIADQLRAERIETVVCVAGCLLIVLTVPLVLELLS
jgi:transposase